nr:immunoglobulin light chain junction region [Macaca mulatta]MOV63622.1 immunoglobulin light chain junction region [Macaca mulatta]
CQQGYNYPMYSF